MSEVPKSDCIIGTCVPEPPSWWLWLEGNIYSAAKSLTRVHDLWMTWSNMKKMLKIEMLGHSKERSSTKWPYLKGGQHEEIISVCVGVYRNRDSVQGVLALLTVSAGRAAFGKCLAYFWICHELESLHLPSYTSHTPPHPRFTAGSQQHRHLERFPIHSSSVTQLLGQVQSTSLCCLIPSQVFPGTESSVRVSASAFSSCWLSTSYTTHGLWLEFQLCYF